MIIDKRLVTSIVKILSVLLEYFHMDRKDNKGDIRHFNLLENFHYVGKMKNIKGSHK